MDRKWSSGEMKKTCKEWRDRLKKEEKEEFIEFIERVTSLQKLPPLRQRSREL